MISTRPNSSEIAVDCTQYPLFSLFWDSCEFMRIPCLAISLCLLSICHGFWPHIMILQSQWRNASRFGLDLNVSFQEICGDQDFLRVRNHIESTEFTKFYKYIGCLIMFGCFGVYCKFVSQVTIIQMLAAVRQADMVGCQEFWSDPSKSRAKLLEFCEAVRYLSAKLFSWHCCVFFLSNVASKLFWSEHNQIWKYT